MPRGRPARRVPGRAAGQRGRVGCRCRCRRARAPSRLAEAHGPSGRPRPHRRSLGREPAGPECRSPAARAYPLGASSAIASPMPLRARSGPGGRDFGPLTVNSTCRSPRHNAGRRAPALLSSDRQCGRLPRQRQLTARAGVPLAHWRGRRPQALRPRCFPHRYGPAAHLGQRLPIERSRRRASSANRRRAGRRSGGIFRPRRPLAADDSFFCRTDASPCRVGAAIGAAQGPRPVPAGEEQWKSVRCGSSAWGKLPKMVSWYEPRLLARIGVRTVISSVFGQYADQRLIQAVTDPCRRQGACARYDYSDPNAERPAQAHRLRRDRRVLDRLRRRRRRRLRAHLHDGLPARPGQPRRRGAGELPHGDILIMGGDQCYPQATREEYKKRLLLPFSWAFRCRAEAQAVRHPRQPRLVRRPDRLRQPVLLRARQALNAKGNVIGGWQCQQHRSYWALKLPHNWWIWGADIQFSKYLDTSQVNYFEAIASRWGRRTSSSSALPSPPGCSPSCRAQDEEENFFKITAIARARGARVVRRGRRRLAPLQPLLRPRARRALLHVGRRRRLPAPHPRAEERDLRALAREASRTQGRPERETHRCTPGRRWKAQALRHAVEANTRRPTPWSIRLCRTFRTSSGAAADASRLRRQARAASSHRLPSATRARPGAICSVWATFVPLLQPGFAIGVGVSTGSSPGSSRASSASEEHFLGKIDKLGIETTVCGRM